MKMIFILMQVKLIFTRKLLHLHWKLSVFETRKLNSLAYTVNFGLLFDFPAPAVVPTSKPSGESSTSIALIVGLVLVIVIVCILIFVGIIYVR